MRKTDKTPKTDIHIINPYQESMLIDSLIPNNIKYKMPSYVSRVSQKRHAHGLSVPQPIPLPPVDPEQFPVVSAVLAMGGVIREIGNTDINKISES